MSYQPIENYGIIGNMRTVAHVGMNGSIDWYCYPHFDSPSVFGAILDDEKGGRFQISADADGVRHKQFYWPSTNVLVTRFLLADGTAELEDFMPVGLPSDSLEYRHVYRRIRCVRGSVRVSVTCSPAFDYGRQTHDTRIEPNGATFKTGSLTLALSTAVPLRKDGPDGVSAEFMLSEGKSQVFILRDDCNEGGVPCPPSEEEAERLLRGTVKFWQQWLSACTYHGRWRDQVHRSALALKLLTLNLLSHETFGVYRRRPMIGKRRPRNPSRNQVSALDNDAEGSSLSRCIVDDEFPRMTVHSKRTPVPVIAPPLTPKEGGKVALDCRFSVHSTLTKRAWPGRVPDTGGPTPSH